MAGQEGSAPQSFDFRPHDLDAALGVQNVLIAQQRQRSLTYEHRHHARSAQSELPVGQQADVLDRGIQVSGCFVDVAIEQSSETVNGPRFEKVARRQAVLGQRFAR